MPIEFPDIVRPLERLSACVTIPLNEHPALGEIFAVTRERRAEIGNNRIVRLLTDLANNREGGHFHFDVWNKRPEDVAIDSVETFQFDFDRVAGLELTINYSAIFLVPHAQVGQASFLRLAGGMNLNIGNINAKFTAQRMIVGDSTYKQFAWSTKDGTTDLEVELRGSIPYQVVGARFLSTAMRVANDGFEKFVVNPIIVPHGPNPARAAR
jgi:hypothetical protein